MKIIKLFFIIILLNAPVFSQGIYNNGAKIVSGTGSYIVVQGNYRAESVSANHGTIDLDGTVSLTGNFTNNTTSGNALANLDADGYLQFKGSGSQNINGTSTSILQLENLRIDNDAIVNTNDVEIEVDGITNLNGNGFLVTVGTKDFNIDGSLTGNGLFNVSSTGKLVRALTASTETSFPIGDGTYNYSFTITSDDNTNPVISISLVQKTPTRNISNDFWNISGPDNLNATLTFRVDKASIAPNTLGSNTQLRYDTGSRYAYVNSDKFSLEEFSDYYIITVTNVNEF